MIRNKLIALALCLSFISSATAAENLGVVNFKRAVENSRVGKHEKETFEGLKSQIESILQEKEKTLVELSKQVNDPDHLDSLSPEAEKELGEKFMRLNQEFSQVQNQYYQTLQQANMKIVQKLSEQIGRASEKVAIKKDLAFVLNDENCFYCKSSLDVTDEVIKAMDQDWDEERRKLINDIKTGE